MSAKPFLDTNVLIYAVARGDPRADRAAELLRSGGTISVQVLNEFANVARRKLGWPWADIIDALGAIRIMCPDPRPIDVAIHEAALAIAARDGLAFYDALLIASALEAGCDEFLSEDMQDGRVIAGRLTIRNPFGQADGR
jgi:predicted nucleic acid-binding protein